MCPVSLKYQFIVVHFTGYTTIFTYLLNHDSIIRGKKSLKNSSSSASLSETLNESQEEGLSTFNQPNVHKLFLSAALHTGV